MIQTWGAGKYETVIYVQSKPWGSSGGNLKVYCSRLMPKIAMGIPRTTPSSLDKTIYRNASDCAITVPSSVSTQNYFTARKSVTGDFELPLYDFGSTLQVEPQDSDMLVNRIVPNIDNSTIH